MAGTRLIITMSFGLLNVTNLSGSNLVAELTANGTFVGTSMNNSYNRRCYIGVNVNECYYCYFGDNNAYKNTIILSVSQFQYGLLYERDSSVSVRNATSESGCYTSNYSLSIDNSGLISGINIYTTRAQAIAAFLEYASGYPINYTANNCTLSAPSTASPGQDVVININPATGYSFRGASGVSIVDSYGDNVPFILNGNQIAFTMPQP